MDRFQRQEFTPIKPPSAAVLRWVAFAVAAVFVLWFLTTFVTVIPAGHRGVVTWFGRVEDRVLAEGLAVVVPIAERVTVVDVRVQPHNFKAIDGASMEYQSVKLTGTMNYRLDAGNVNLLYQKVGLDFAERILDPAFNDVMKEVLPTYSIVDILPNRDKIRQKAVGQLQAVVGPYHIIVDNIFISDITFSPEYTKAIEDKQMEAQRVERERQILAQKEIQAQQQVVVARGQGDALAAAAKGDAEATLIKARAQADANSILARSLTPELVQYTYVQKIGDKVQVILVPSGQQFLLDTKGLTTPPQTAPAK